jgi:hypothetical protein
MLGTIAAIASLASAGLAAAGTIAAGRAQEAEAQAQALMLQQRAEAEEKMSEFEAAQLEMQGREELAEAQQEAAQLRRRKNLALSQLTARAASSGFTATDPTALSLASDIAKYGTLQEQMALYGGKSRRAGLEAQAAARRYSGATGVQSYLTEAEAAKMAGKSAKTASYLSAGGTIAGSTSTMATKYAKKYGYG